MASKKGQDSMLPQRPSVFKPNWKTSPKGNHGKLRDYLNFKMTKLFSRIGEVSGKKSISFHNKATSTTLEEPLPDDERLSSEDDMPLWSRQINKFHTTETDVEMPTKTERLPSETQKVETSPKLTEEISAKAGDLSEEGRTALTPQQSLPNGGPRKFSANTPCPKKYSFLLDHGVQLTEAAKDLSDEQMNLLWEDIFKPLDFSSILHDRRKQLSSNSDVETNMQNLFSII